MLRRGALVEMLPASHDLKAQTERKVKVGCSCLQNTFVLPTDPVFLGFFIFVALVELGVKCEALCMLCMLSH